MPRLAETDTEQPIYGQRKSRKEVLQVEIQDDVLTGMVWRNREWAVGKAAFGWVGGIKSKFVQNRAESLSTLLGHSSRRAALFLGDPAWCNVSGKLIGVGAPSLRNRPAIAAQRVWSPSHAAISTVVANVGIVGDSHPGLTIAWE